MQRILIATDFSTAARNASLYGVELAKHFETTAILFSSYRVPPPPSAFIYTLSKYDLMLQTDRRLLREADFLDPTKELIEIACDEGFAGDPIISIANEKKVDYIIAGMKGTGKHFKNVLGSTAISLAVKSNIPVILVPEGARFKDPVKILFVNDGHTASGKDIPKGLTEVAEHFKSELYVVKMTKNKNKESIGISGHIQKLTKEIQIPGSSFEYPIDTDIRHALNEFIEINEVDMLVMMTHKQDWIDRIYRKSHTREMNFHTNIPSLILPGTTSAQRFTNNKWLVEGNNSLIAAN